MNNDHVLSPKILDSSKTIQYLEHIREEYAIGIVCEGSSLAKPLIDISDDYKTFKDISLKIASNTGRPYTSITVKDIYTFYYKNKEYKNEGKIIRIHLLWGDRWCVLSHKNEEVFDICHRCPMIIYLSDKTTDGCWICSGCGYSYK